MALYSGARCKNFEREVSRNLRKPPWLAQQYLLHHNPSPGDPGLARITTLAARVGNLVCLHHLPRQPAPVPRRAPQQPWPLPDDPGAPSGCSHHQPLQKQHQCQAPIPDHASTQHLPSSTPSATAHSNPCPIPPSTSSRPPDTQPPISRKPDTQPLVSRRSGMQH